MKVEGGEEGRRGGGEEGRRGGGEVGIRSGGGKGGRKKESMWKEERKGGRVEAGEVGVEES